MRRSVFVLGVLVLVVFTVFTTAQAASLTVTNSTSSTATGDGCSLVEAIHNANNDAATYPDCAAGSGADTIVLSTNITLNQVVDTGSALYGPSGLPRITSAITINGGTGRTISRADGSSAFRFFFVTGTGNLTLNSVSLSKGSVPKSNDGPPDHPALSSNGGAVLNYEGIVTINGGTFSSNTAFLGGAVHMRGGTLAISHTTMSGNTATGGGGAIEIWYGAGTFTAMRLMANTSPYGGGLSVAYANATVQGSTMSGNSAGQGGGVYFNNGNLSISGSTISGNTATGGNGGGGLWSDSEPEAVGLFIKDTSISHNTATNGNGGAINNSGNISITNSTISRNTSTIGYGAGLYQGYEGVATINSSTITRNNAGNKGGGLAGQTGLVTGYQQIFVSNSIVAGNKSRGITTRMDADCASIPLHGSRPPVTLIFSTGHNVVGMATGCPANGTGDKTVAPANVFTSVLDYNLASNGGPGQTHALLLSSPAIDAADCATASPKDQRGVPRGADGNGDSVPACDIGSYEAPTIPVTITATPTFTPTNTATFTPTATGTNTFTPVAPGTPITVTNGTSSTLTGDGCSLVEAIANANADDYVYPDCAPGNGEDTIIITTDVSLKHSVEVDLRIGHAQCPDDYPDEPDLNDLPPSYITVMDGGTALPRITSTITIQGNGHTIERAGTTIAFRLFRVTDQGNLTLDSVTLKGGYVYYLDGYYKGNGGALLNDGGILTINNSIIAFNKTSYNCAVNEALGYGGALYNNRGTVTINNSSFAQNIALNGAGGAIFSIDGEVTLNNSTLSQNYAIALNNYTAGGGIMSVNTTLTINDSVIEYNGAYEYENEGTGVNATSGYGGTNPVITTISGSTFTNNNIVLQGDATITNTLVSGNTSTGIRAVNLSISGSTVSGNGGYGIYVDSALTMSSTTVSGNAWAGIYAEGIDHPATISGSTLSNNGGFGLFYSSGSATLPSLTITNSTFSGNAEGGVTSSGSISTVLTVLSSTITNNQGVGLDVQTGIASIGSSIIAGNATDCGVQSATLISQGYNLVGSSTGCASNGTGDLTVNPADVFTTVLDQTLSDNGGNTLTHALLASSPAIDAGNCAASSLDQRGVPRGGDGNGDSVPGCDIGAYEVDTAAPLTIVIPAANSSTTELDSVPAATTPPLPTASLTPTAILLTETSTPELTLTILAPTSTPFPTLTPEPTNTIESTLVPPTSTPEPTLTETLTDTTVTTEEASS